MTSDLRRRYVWSWTAMSVGEPSNKRPPWIEPLWSPAGRAEPVATGGKSASGDGEQRARRPRRPDSQCILTLTTGILLNTVNRRPARALRAYVGR